MGNDRDRSPWVGENPPWDEEAAEALRGAYVVIGMTYVLANGQLDERVQMHGRINVVDAERGIGVALEGARSGETFWLPAKFQAFQPARPGEYRLKATGEVITDPDYTTSWTITRPPKT
jgi:hypothetical protein